MVRDCQQLPVRVDAARVTGKQMTTREQARRKLADIGAGIIPEREANPRS